MIITRTPLRVSFAGGGSDLKAYYSEHGGAVVSTSIDKFVYLSMHPLFYQSNFFLKYSKTEHVASVADIEHRIIRQVLQDYGIEGVDFSSSADVPSGTGLGSSSAFTAGLTTLCNAYTSVYMSQQDIARYACEVEIEKLAEPIGKQDQYACAVGGLNFIRFNQDDTVSVEKILLSPEKREELQLSLMMFYMGDTRSASEILSEQRKNSRSGKSVESLHRLVALAEELRNELQSAKLEAMGDILHRGWMYKKELAKGISNPRIDSIYDRARAAGASGGKLLGAGGTGFILLNVPLDRQEAVRAELSELREFQFRFETEGSSVIYYSN